MDGICLRVRARHVVSAVAVLLACIGTGLMLPVQSTAQNFADLTPSPQLVE
jgi:hypothetical protein